MSKGKVKYLVIGAVIGSLVSTASVAVASNAATVAALLKNGITFKFDGVEKKLDDKYSILSYKNSTYVPARFVAEQLGATVGWDEATQTITIESLKTPTAPTPAPALSPVPTATAAPSTTSEKLDWSSYAGTWKSSNVTLELKIMELNEADASLTFAAKERMADSLGKVTFNTQGSGTYKVTQGGVEFTVSINLVGSNLYLTVIKPATNEIVITDILKPASGQKPAASTNAPTKTEASAVAPADLANYLGKWTYGKMSLELSEFNGAAGKLKLVNEGTEGPPSFETKVVINETGMGSADIEINGASYIVQVALSNNQVKLIHINRHSGSLTSTVFSTKS